MPWTPKDASKHKKGLDRSESVKWAAIANAVRRQTGDDVEAIRTANSKTKG